MKYEGQKEDTMLSTKQYDNPLSERQTVNTDQLRQLLSCGRNTAVRIGEEAGAKIKIGKRSLWNVSKVQHYLDSISE